MGRGRGPALVWEHQTRDEFERTVELLVRAEYEATHDVVAFDGRGGDGGLDVLATRREPADPADPTEPAASTPSSGVLVFQLKHYLDGLSGKQKGRRRHVEQSLARALQQQPDEWILVAPFRMTPSDFTYLSELNAKHAIPIRVWDRTKLDRLLALQPTVIDLLARDDEVLRNAKILGQERAVLAGGADDLATRLKGLRRTVDAADDWWTWDYTDINGRTALMLRAKHPDSAERSPVSISFGLDMASVSGDEAEQSLQTFRRSIEFGLSAQVTLPRGAVRRFQVDGPPLVRGEPTDDVVLQWIRQPNPQIVGQPVTVEMLDESGTITSTYHGVATDGSPGSQGLSLKASFGELLTLTFLLPHDEKQECQLDSAFDSQRPNRPVAQLRETTQMVLDMQNAHELVVHVQGLKVLHAVTGGQLRWPSGQDWLDQMVRVRDLCDDLEAVQREANNRFPVPSELTMLQRITLRAARMMLDGECVMHPTWRSMDLTLPGLDNDGVATLAGEAGGQLLITTPQLNLEVAGHTLRLPETRLWHPNARLRDREQVLARLTAGERDVPAVVEAADDTSLRMWMPGRWTDDRPVVPQPWGLPGVEEALPAA